MRQALITPYALKERGYIHSNVEDSILRVVIQRAQDIMIEPITGTRLFKRLLNGIDNEDLNANETILLDDYIFDLIASGCDYKSVSATTYEIRNKATGTTNDEFLKPVSETQLNDFEDGLRSDFEFYRQRTIMYLREKYQLFPELYEYTNEQNCLENNKILPDKGKPNKSLYF